MLIISTSIRGIANNVAELLNWTTWKLQGRAQLNCSTLLFQLTYAILRKSLGESVIGKCIVLYLIL